jgi:DNA-binding transcriptional MerR regulator
MPELLTIGELARRTGVTTSALRYYDELGLVRPTRRVSGHRRYAVNAVAAVGVVRFLQEVGFTLAETRRLIASRKRSPVAWRALAVRKSEDLRHRIAREEAARQGAHGSAESGPSFSSA